MKNFSPASQLPRALKESPGNLNGGIVLRKGDWPLVKCKERDQENWARLENLCGLLRQTGMSLLT